MTTPQISTTALPHVAALDVAPAEATAVASDGAVAAAVAGWGIPEATVTAWDKATPWQVRTVLAAQVDGVVVAAALAVHRPFTQYERLAGLWIADGTPAPVAAAAAEAIVGATVALATSAGAVIVKIDAGPADETLLGAAVTAGFTLLDPPALGAPLPHSPEDVPRGLVLTIGTELPTSAIPYMRQTTDYTCGAVATTMALAARDLVPTPNRRDELELWREATLVPACEPFGLAAAMAKRGLLATVVTSVDGPILLEDTTDASVREMRTFVQEDFKARTLAAGGKVEYRWIEVEEIAALVDGGASVLVLIDQHPMHAEPCPHWVTVHGTYPGGFWVDDPWTDAVYAESWLDAHLLPVPAATLDRLVRWGEPAYRSVVVLPAA